MPDRHQHRCGFSNEQEAGCGHVFEHDARSGLPRDERERLHMCPRCGCGPWFWHYEQSEGKFRTRLVKAGVSADA